MDLVNAPRMVGWLRAAGEPTRLRLLALIAQGELSVSDLAAAIGQSEPRVSRHLRILAEAGLIERQRQGQWVHYRSAAVAETTGFVRGLLAQLDRRDGRLALDRSAARSALVADGAGASGESRLGRALAALIAAEPAASGGAALVVGVAHPELLLASAPAARSCVALAGSRRTKSSSAASASSKRSISSRISAPLIPALRPGSTRSAKAKFSSALFILPWPYCAWAKL